MRKILFVLVMCMFPLSLADSQSFVNGGFESGGGSGWTTYSSGGYTIIGTGTTFASTDITPAVLPRTGSYMCRLGGYSYEVNSITQTISLPNVSPLYISFWTQTRSANTSECGGLWVGALVKAIVNGTVIDSSYLCQYNDLYAWTNYFIDVSAIKGQNATLVFKAEAANSVWSFVYFDDIGLTTTTAVPAATTSLPEQFSLGQNFPNPFNPNTVISYSLPVMSQVRLSVYDLLGREVVRLVDGLQQPGSRTVDFDATNLPSGFYVYRITAGNFRDAKKLVILK